MRWGCNSDPPNPSSPARASSDGPPAPVGQGEGSAGGCLGPGKCLSPRCGFVTAAWKNFGAGFFFLLGRGAGGEALLAGEPTWQDWASLGLEVKQDALCRPLPLLGFWLPLGLDPQGWGAQLPGTACSASLIYFSWGV